MKRRDVGYEESRAVALWFWAIVLNVSGILHVATGCGGPEKPIVQPNPDFANCEAAKDKRENECLIEAGTREAFDDCIARVRKSCVDGGTK